MPEREAEIYGVGWTNTAPLSKKEIVGGIVVVLGIALLFYAMLFL
jgi:hypothetical protein